MTLLSFYLAQNGAKHWGKPPTQHAFDPTPFPAEINTFKESFCKTILFISSASYAFWYVSRRCNSFGNACLFRTRNTWARIHHPGYGLLCPLVKEWNGTPQHGLECNPAAPIQPDIEWNPAVRLLWHSFDIFWDIQATNPHLKENVVVCALSITAAVLLM